MIHVRPYLPYDRAFVLSLAPRLTIGMPPWRDAQLCLAAVQDWIAGSIQRNGHQTMVFVAEDGQGERLGFASVTHETHFTGERQAYIGELATSETAQGRGAGRALLQACEQWARGHGCRVLAVATGAANEGALGFYHHLGYRDEDVRLVKLLQEPSGATDSHSLSTDHNSPGSQVTLQVEPGTRKTDCMAGYQGTEGTRPYAGAGWYYAEYRERVSAEFIALLAAHLGWSREHRILDLGAGPAQLSLLVAPLVAQVVAIDPEPDMLGEGERRARAAGIDNIRFVLASSDDLPALRPTLGTFRTALMGLSFHWMLQKERVLRDLGTMIDPVDGAVAIISDTRVAVPDALRVATARVHAVLERHLVDVPPGPHPRGRHDPFETILARSPFPRIETIERVYQVRVHPTVESLVGAEYTMSHALARLGSRRERFEQDVRAALADLGDIGEVTLTRRDEGLIGRR